MKTATGFCIVCGASPNLTVPPDFNELDRWAKMNSPAWRAVTDFAENMGMEETKRLHMLCFVLLQQNLSTERQLIVLAQKYGFSS